LTTTTTTTTTTIVKTRTDLLRKNLFH